MWPSGGAPWVQSQYRQPCPGPSCPVLASAGWLCRSPDRRDERSCGSHLRSCDRRRHCASSQLVAVCPFGDRRVEPFVLWGSLRRASRHRVLDGGRQLALQTPAPSPGPSLCHSSPLLCRSCELGPGPVGPSASGAGRPPCACRRQGLWLRACTTRERSLSGMSRVHLLSG